MGQRTLKRVPLDFDHPHNEVWPGYLSPEPRPCPASCEHGATVAAHYVAGIAHLLLILGDDARRGQLHPWVQGIPVTSAGVPARDMLELTDGLVGEERARAASSPFGYDAIARWKATHALIKAAGLDPDVWGICQTCHGLGYHPDDEAIRDAWEPSEPPTGDGWQLWETTSEGSPVSPVFASAEALAHWCADHATLFAGHRATYEHWLAMFREDDVEWGSTMALRVPDSGRR